jgi:phytol kinase
MPILGHPLVPWLLLPILALVYTLGLSLLAQRLSGSRLGAPVAGRKVLHAGVFTGAVPAQLLMGFWGVVLYGATIAVSISTVALLRGRNRLSRIMTVDREGHVGALIFLPLVATALGGLLSLLLVGDFAVVGYLACGWGDAGGELVGGSMGRRPYRPLFSLGRRPRRTWEGSLAVVALGTLGAWAGLGVLGFGPLSAVSVALLCGLGEGVAESVSGKGTDNLWGQLAPSILAWWILG